MSNANKFYLKMLAGVRTSPLPGGSYVGGNQDVYYDYCKLRNAAKDLLSSHEDVEAGKNYHNQ